MTRLEKLLRRIGVVNTVQPTWRDTQRAARVFLDIGSHTTKLLLEDTLIIQPTCFVQHRSTLAVLAVGDQALKMLGKLPEQARAVFPVRDGKVQDQAELELYINTLLQEYLRQGIRSFLRPHRIYLTVLHPEHDAQVRAWMQSLKRWGKVSAVHALSDVLWSSVDQQHLFAQDGCVIDVGAMTTKFFMYTNGKVVSQAVLEVGGDTWTDEVMMALRRECQLEIGWMTAEHLKIRALQFDHASQKHTVQGKDLLTGLPTTRVIDEDIFGEKKQALLQQLTEEFQRLAQKSSPELVAKLHETGVYLTGGGSRVKGLAKQLEKVLKLPIHSSRFPQRDAVQGLVLLRKK